MSIAPYYGEFFCILKLYVYYILTYEYKKSPQKFDRKKKPDKMIWTKCIVLLYYFSIIMPNNERSLTNAIDNGIAYAKEAKKYTQKVDKKYEDVKNSIKWWINSINNWFNTTNKKIENKVNQAVNATKNTYRDVSNSVKSSIDIWIKNTKELAKNTMKFAAEKVVQYENFKMKLANDVKNWAIQWITYVKDKWIMVINYGNKKINVFVWKAKEEAIGLGKALQSGAINSIKYAKNAWEITVQLGKNSLKYSVATAVAAGILVYKGWEFVVNKNIQLQMRVANKVVTETIKAKNYVKNEVKSGIELGKNAAYTTLKWVADISNQAANKIKPPVKTSTTIASK